jgi:hypothetical protein
MLSGRSSTANRPEAATGFIGYTKNFAFRPGKLVQKQNFLLFMKMTDGCTYT